MHSRRPGMVPPAGLVTSSSLYRWAEVNPGIERISPRCCSYQPSKDAGVPIRFSGLVERGHEVIASGDGEARHAEDVRDVRLVPAVVQLFRYDLRTAAEDDVDGQQRTSLVSLEGVTGVDEQRGTGDV